MRWRCWTRSRCSARAAASARRRRAPLFSPSSASRPEVGLSSSPIMLSKVLLPEPDGPMSATNSPRRAPGRRAAPRPRRAARHCRPCHTLKDVRRVSHGSPPPDRVAPPAAPDGGRRHAGHRREQHRRDEQRRLEDQREQLGAVGVACPRTPQRQRPRAQRRAHQCAQQPQRPCSRKHPQNLPARAPIARGCRSHGSDYGNHQHAGDAEGDGQPHQQPDGTVLDRLCERIMVKNCALVAIQLSAFTGASRAIASRSSPPRRCPPPSPPCW